MDSTAMPDIVSDTTSKCYIDFEFQIPYYPNLMNTGKIQEAIANVMTQQLHKTNINAQLITNDVHIFEWAKSPESQRIKCKGWFPCLEIHRQNYIDSMNQVHKLKILSKKFIEIAMDHDANADNAESESPTPKKPRITIAQLKITWSNEHKIDESKVLTEAKKHFDNWDNARKKLKELATNEPDTDANRNTADDGDHDNDNDNGNDNDNVIGNAIANQSASESETQPSAETPAQAQARQPSAHVRRESGRGFNSSVEYANNALTVSRERPSVALGDYDEAGDEDVVEDAIESSESYHTDSEEKSDTEEKKDDEVDASRPYIQQLSSFRESAQQQAAEDDDEHLHHLRSQLRQTKTELSVIKSQHKEDLTHLENRIALLKKSELSAQTKQISMQFDEDVLRKQLKHRTNDEVLAVQNELEKVTKEKDLQIARTEKRFELEMSKLQTKLSKTVTIYHLDLESTRKQHRLEVTQLQHQTRTLQASVDRETKKDSTIQLLRQQLENANASSSNMTLEYEQVIDNMNKEHENEMRNEINKRIKEANTMKREITELKQSLSAQKLQKNHIARENRTLKVEAQTNSNLTEHIRNLLQKEQKKSANLERKYGKLKQQKHAQQQQQQQQQQQRNSRSNSRGSDSAANTSNSTNAKQASSEEMDDREANHHRVKSFRTRTNSTAKIYRDGHGSVITLDNTPFPVSTLESNTSERMSEDDNNSNAILTDDDFDEDDAKLNFITEETHQQRMSIAKQEIAALKAKVSTLVLRVSDLKQTNTVSVAQLQQKIGSLQESSVIANENFNKQKSILEYQIQNIQKQSDKMESRSKKLLKSLKNNLSTKDDQVSALNEDLADKDEQIQSLKQNMEYLEQQVQSLRYTQDEILDWQDEVQNFERECNELIAELDGQSELLANKESELNNIKHELHNRDRTIGTLESLVHQLKADETKIALLNSKKMDLSMQLKNRAIQQKVKMQQKLQNHGGSIMKNPEPRGANAHANANDNGGGGGPPQDNDNDNDNLAFLSQALGLDNYSSVDSYYAEDDGDDYAGDLVTAPKTPMADALYATAQAQRAAEAENANNSADRDDEKHAFVFEEELKKPLNMIQSTPIVSSDATVTNSSDSTPNKNQRARVSVDMSPNKAVFMDEVNNTDNGVVVDDDVYIVDDGMRGQQQQGPPQPPAEEEDAMESEEDDQEEEQQPPYNNNANINTNANSNNNTDNSDANQNVDRDLGGNVIDLDAIQAQHEREIDSIRDEFQIEVSQLQSEIQELTQSKLILDDSNSCLMNDKQALKDDARELKDEVRALKEMQLQMSAEVKEQTQRIADMEQSKMKTMEMFGIAMSEMREQISVYHAMLFKQGQRINAKKSSQN